MTKQSSIVKTHIHPPLWTRAKNKLSLHQSSKGDRVCVISTCCFYALAGSSFEFKVDIGMNSSYSLSSSGCCFSVCITRFGHWLDLCPTPWQEKHLTVVKETLITGGWVEVVVLRRLGHHWSSSSICSAICTTSSRVVMWVVDSRFAILSRRPKWKLATKNVSSSTRKVTKFMRFVSKLCNCVIALRWILVFDEQLLIGPLGERGAVYMLS